MTKLHGTLTDSNIVANIQEDNDPSHLLAVLILG